MLIKNFQKIYLRFWWLVLIWIVYGVFLVPQASEAMPFTYTYETTKANDGNTAGIRLTQTIAKPGGGTNTIESNKFEQVIKNGKAKFTLMGDIQVKGAPPGTTIPVDNWTDWKAGIVFPVGGLIPDSQGNIKKNVAMGAESNLVMAFSGFPSWSDSLFDQFGFEEVPIPDFLADINGDGTITSDENIFVGVDANQWFSFDSTQMPLFRKMDVGLTCNISSGMALSCEDGKGLAGFLFSTQELTIPDLTGFAATPGSLFSGEVIVVGNHLHAAVPEPSSVLLFGSGLLGMLALKRKFL
ncbi:MAG: PEP-CTERM sorting domain-containing protein [Nitrospirota bacterium]|nr:PEP-CTERM sorting domain-containing protein [Nitrospirota bacterium]